MRMTFLRALMTLLAVLPAFAMAADIGDSDIREYQISMEMGCRDSAHKRGDTPDVINASCSCITDTLLSTMKREDWQVLIVSHRAHDEKGEMAMMSAHQRDVAACLQTHEGKGRGPGSPFVDGGGIREHLLGKWAWKLRNGCKETYEYRADGTLYTTSGAEKSDETFTVSETPEPGVFYYKLIGKVTKDYGGKDCPGSDEDNTGQEDTSYVFFAPAGKFALICAEPSMDHCFGPLIKQ